VGPLRGCVSDEDIAGFVAGDLPEPASRHIAEHLEVCESCRGVVTLADTRKPSAAPPSSRVLTAGDRVGRFIVQGQVGTGGMGSVFAAYDPDLDRKVALKLVRADATGTQMQARLMREAQAMARLHHPEVITVYDVGSVGDEVFIAMELLDGGTLRGWLRSGPRRVDEIVDRFVRAGEGLAAAHAAGLVHRDFKPDNVLIGSDGRQRVTDFGLVRLLKSEAKPEPAVAMEEVMSPLEVTLTQQGTLLGTPAYMAPEQFDGIADARSDQFTFCASLYQALYGELPFAAERMSDYLVQVVQGNVRPAPRDTRVPARLRALLLRGLRARPEERHPSMRELLDALRATRRRQARRYPLAALIAVCLAVGGLVLFTTQRARPTWHAEVRQLGTAYEENSDWVDISPDGKSIAYPSDRDGSWRIYVGALMGSSSRAVTPPSSDLYLNFPRWTRDGRALLYVEQRDGASIIDRITLADGKIEELARGAHEAEDCGGALLFLENKSPDCLNCPRLVTRANGVTREIFRGAPGSNAESIRCNRAGTQVAFSCAPAAPVGSASRESLCLVGIDGTGLRKIVDGGSPSFPFFHPDGRSLLYTWRRDKGAQIWEQSLAGGAPRRLTDGSFDLAPVVSPDGRVLVFNEDTTSMPMFAYSGGRQERLTHTIGDMLFQPVITHDGRELIMASVRVGQAKASQLIRLALTDGSQQSLGEGRTPALAADDSVIYFTRTEGVFAMPHGGGSARLVTRLPFQAAAMSFGGDGALHLTLDTSEGKQAWRVTLDGMLTREAPAPYRIVLPAPSGGWRVARAGQGNMSSLELVPPGGTLGSATNKRLPVLPWVWEASGSSLIGWDERRYVRVGVDGSVQPLFARSGLSLGVAVSSDGKTVYTSASVARVRREIITNYGELPRP
jgi:serine/threonine protein kinase